MKMDTAVDTGEADLTSVGRFSSVMSEASGNT